MGIGVGLMTQQGSAAAWPPLNPIFGRIPTDGAGVSRWTTLVEEMQTNPASQLLLFLPVFLTAPVFAFVCGFLLHSAVG